VVDLMGLDRVQERDDRELVEEVALPQLDPGFEVRDPLEMIRGGAAHHAIDLVALLEKELREVGAVLAGDARDERPTLRHNTTILAGPPSTQGIFSRRAALAEQPPRHGTRATLIDSG